MDGVVSAKNDPTKRVSYGDLVAAASLTMQLLKVSGAGFALNVEGTAKTKDPQYTVVGTSLPRVDMAPKILGQFQYITDVRVPGMLHGRVVRPAGVGAAFVSLDDAEAKSIAGYVKTVVEKDFVGVVAETEWAAIKAAKAIKVTWTAPVQAFPEQKDLYAHMRSATPKATRETAKQGDTATAMAAAARKIEARYDVPFQSHATMGPGCAVADVHTDGVTTVWSGGQKPHALQKGFAQLLGVPVNMVRVVWMQDAGSYGRPGFEDAAADAVLLSKGAGKPVRVQWMRADMTAWGTKGPACVFDLSAALDAAGNVSAVQFTSRAFSGGEIMYLPDTAGNYLGAQLTGIRTRQASTNSRSGAVPRRRTGSRISARWRTSCPASTTSHLRCDRRTCAIRRVRRRRLPSSRSSTSSLPRPAWIRSNSG